MPRLSFLPVLIVATTLFVLTPTCVAAQAASSATSGSTEREQLAAVLGSDGSYADKLAACKRLALIGDESSVAALATLLGDEQLSHAARIGLEAIPDPAAADALRRGLSQVQGERLVGVINSLGARRDPQAVAQLGPLLDHSDPQVASAAAAALGNIATPAAVQRLEPLLATAIPTVRPAVGHALLACAAAFLRQGDRESAIAVYDHVRQAELPSPLLTAATRGAILARGQEGIRLLAEELGADNGARFAAALGIGRELPDEDITATLVGRLPGLPPERQALLLAVIGDRGDVAARPAVVEAAKKAPKPARLAAVRVLATLGDGSATAVLLEAALGADPDIAAAALDTLAVLVDPQLDDTLTRMIETAEATPRRVAVELAGRRRITSAVSALQKVAANPDEETRRAAIASLGQTIGPQQLPVLTGRLVTTTSDRERTAVENALKIACRRAVDKEACGRSLVTCLPQASPPVRCFVLELLGSVGGPTALEAVFTAALDEDEAIQDVATRVLGQWLSPDAAPTLLELARKLPRGKYQIRALRGCIRILRQMDLPDDQKLAMCREALNLAERDQERALVLEALGRIPSSKALALVLPHMKTASLKKTASLAAVSIGEKIVPQQRAAAVEAAKQVLRATDDNELVRRAKELLMQAEATPAAAP